MSMFGQKGGARQIRTPLKIPKG